MASEEQDLVERLSLLGFSEKAIKENQKNKKLYSNLQTILGEGGITSSSDVDSTSASLLNHLSTLTVTTKPKERPYIVHAIKTGKLKNNIQVEAAIKYFKDFASATNDGVDETAFDQACGVEEVSDQVNKYVINNKEQIMSERYKILSSTISYLKTDTDLKWAAPQDVKKATDASFLALLGPKDDRDAPPKKGKAKPDVKTREGDEKVIVPQADSNPLDHDKMFKSGWLSELHKPGGNKQKLPENMKAHLEFTKGGVFTRFPPEPNGYLHIGHAKAITVNFGYARFHNGLCYLRFDDTNPEAEHDIFFKEILNVIKWLGFKPYKVTHSSDHFDELYALAHKLIDRGKAYVCSCTAEEINKQRGQSGKTKPYACPHRGRPIEESRAEFIAMHDGKYKPQEACLRMLQDLESGNPQMWDLTAYRVLNAHHHRTGDKWKIYPTYDFTHCLCDSFENISHSLCTTEFSMSRESYDWLCNALDVYRPQQNEYARLNLGYTIMSKRKIALLVERGIVDGWDDPRLFTLVALRRKGVPPGAILSFVNDIGVSDNDTMITEQRYEHSIRRYLEETVPRLMMVIDPVLVVIQNLPDDHVEEVSVPFNPKDTSMGEHKVPFTNQIYVDRSDFREEDSADYFRLAPGKSVGLFKVPYPIRVTGFKKDDTTGMVVEITAHYENDVPFKKPKTYIQWVAKSDSHNSPVQCEARIFHRLFKVEKPGGEATKEEFLAQVSDRTKDVYANAMMEIGFHEVRKRAPWPALEGEKDATEFHPESVRFQALRVAYFAMDKDSTDEKIVLNKIVGLKEDIGKMAKIEKDDTSKSNQRTTKNTKKV